MKITITFDIKDEGDTYFEEEVHRLISALWQEYIKFPLETNQWKVVKETEM